MLDIDAHVQPAHVKIRRARKGGVTTVPGGLSPLDSTFHGKPWPAAVGTRSQNDAPVPSWLEHAGEGDEWRRAVLPYVKGPDSRDCAAWKHAVRRGASLPAARPREEPGVSRETRSSRGDPHARDVVAETLWSRYCGTNLDSVPRRGMTSRRRRASLTRGFHEKPRSLSLPHLSRQYSERESRAPPTVPTALNTPRRTARHTARVHVKPARSAAVSDVGARRDERTTRTPVRETQSSSPSCGSARAADSMPSSSSATKFHVEHMRHPSPQC